MTANSILKRQIIIEIMALMVLVGVICYTAYAIDKSNEGKVKNTAGFVTVLDDKKIGKLEILSDGAGLNTTGVTYTITNNNTEKRQYKIVIKPSITDEKILDHIKVSVNDLFVANLTDLESNDKGYIITTHELKSGYTKIHIIKLWYDLDSDSNIVNNDIKFEFNIIA